MSNRPRQLSTVCDASWKGRHEPQYENGRIVFLDATRLTATCQHCGARIGREHHRTPWWKAAADPSSSLDERPVSLGPDVDISDTEAAVRAEVYAEHVCGRCGFTRGQHQGIELLCPFYSTFRARKDGEVARLTAENRALREALTLTVEERGALDAAIGEFELQERAAEKERDRKYAERMVGDLGSLRNKLTAARSPEEPRNG